MTSRLLTVVAFAFVLLIPAIAAAQGTLYIGGKTGHGGEFEGDFDSNAPFGLLDFEIENEDMVSTWGVMAQYDTVVQKYLAVGGRFSVASFNSEARDDENFDRDWLMNLGVAPKLRYAFSGTPARIYATTPVGLSIILPSEDWEDENGVQTEVGVSWHLSLLVGADYSFTDDFGVFVEMGWALQNINWEGETVDGDFSTELDGGFGQFGLNLGVTLPL